MSGLPVGQPLRELQADTSASRAGETTGRPRTGNSSSKSASAKTGPSASRTRIARHPLGNTARATRTVSSGISANSTPGNDTKPPQKHDDGLHNPNGSYRPSSRRPRIYQQRPGIRPGLLVMVPSQAGVSSRAVAVSAVSRREFPRL